MLLTNHNTVKEGKQNNSLHRGDMSQCTSHTRIDFDGRGGWKVVVVHAGGVEGWMEGADLVFGSKTNSTDYHDEMDSKHHMDWFTKQLLLNEADSVLDNATYYDKQKDRPPTTANKKTMAR